MAALGGRRPRPDPVPRGLAENGLAYESVWDYPRPPRVEPETRRVTVALGNEPIAESERALRVLETAGAPTVYIPPEDIVDGVLAPVEGTSFCEWKGTASYLDVRAASLEVRRGGWSYPRPSNGYAQLAGFVSFYTALLDCRLGSEIVSPQPGGFYGGWVTAEIVGPIKGDPGTGGW